MVLHATGTSATGWLLNVARLSEQHQAFAVSIIGRRASRISKHCCGTAGTAAGSRFAWCRRDSEASLWTPAGLWTTVGWGVSHWWRSGASGPPHEPVRPAPGRPAPAVSAAPRAAPR